MHIPEYFAIIMQLSIKGVGARPYDEPLYSLPCTVLLFPSGHSQPSWSYGS